MSYLKRIEVCCPGINPRADFVLQKDKSTGVVTVKTWNSLETQPTHEEILAVTDAQVEELIASRQVDVEQVDTFLRAFALVMLDELNLLRAEAGLSERTRNQLKTAMLAKL